MKRFLALGLTLVLALSLALPLMATAAEVTLSDVTLLVKGRLGIGDEYTSFYGDYSDYGNMRYWYLNWSNDEAQLNVTCDSKGLIYDYYFYSQNSDYSVSYGYAPKFSTLSEEDVYAAVEAFLEEILDDNEGFILSNADNIMPLVGESRYHYISGTLTRNGYETQTSFSMSLETSTLNVRYFSRYDSYMFYEEADGAPVIAISAEDAAALLASGYSMQLRYVISEDDENLAVLRYFPYQAGTLYVATADGTLYDLEDYYTDARSVPQTSASGAVANRDTVAEEAEMGAKQVTLSEVEEAGIAKMDGVLSQDEIDGLIRAIEELGLNEDYSLDNISYSLNPETEEVTATLRYCYRLSTEILEKVYGISVNDIDEMIAWGDGYSIIKTVRVDGRTGALESLYTSYPYVYGEYDNSVDKEALQAIAEAFLTKYYAEPFASTKLGESSDYSTLKYYRRPVASFSYERYANDVPCDANYFYLSVNSETGYIDAFSYEWNDELQFEGTESIVSEEDALSAYLEALSTKLIYVTIPKAYSAYYGYSYTRLLSYGLVNEQNVYAVEAKTGELLVSEMQEIAPIVYTDLVEGSSLKEAAEALAECGIGYVDGALSADAGISLRELLVLLLQAGGNTNAASFEDETLYYYALSNGILARGSYDLDAGVSRIGLVKILLDMSGYGRAAALSGIYVCDFADEAALTEADYGYAAIAKGMGIVEGDENNNLRPDDMATRGEALLMLYNFMNRSI